MSYDCRSRSSLRELSQVSLFLKAVADENRLKIICFLRKQERCVCEIVEFLNLPQNLVSHHLGVLREREIVSTKKDGLKVLYSLNDKNISKTLKFLNFLISKL